MVVVPFVPLIVSAVSGVSNVSVDADVGVDGGEFLEIAHHFVTFGVMLFVVNRLLEILKTLRFGSPFVKENADRFRGLGFALLIGEGAKIRIRLFIANIFCGCGNQFHNHIVARDHRRFCSLRSVP